MDDKYETNMTTELTGDQVGSMGILSGYNASTGRKKDIILAMQ